MKTPILDFVKGYAASDTVRLHMPGHKGKGSLNVEALDITEIEGADDLRSPKGIILESENAATELFGTAHTYYLTEGSTLGIKSMLALACGEGGRVLAGRNVHKSFIHAAALLDLSVSWMYSGTGEHLCKCSLDADEVRAALLREERLPDAVYVTSPDYLGNILDIKGIGEVCDEFGVPLLVDNAHGAYLNFLSPSIHPIALGASMCCDSAHKTLPALTGAAYLHISKKAEKYTARARSIISVFSSTSPSYLILASLDACNRTLSEDYSASLWQRACELDEIKAELALRGIPTEDCEPLKLVLRPARFGYTSYEIADLLRAHNIEPEFVDCDYIVMMISPYNAKDELSRLKDCLTSASPHDALPVEECRSGSEHRVALSLRKAVFAPCEALPAEKAVGRICAAPTVSCPPAIAVVVSGEVISEDDVAVLLKYGIDNIEVVIE